MATIQKIEGQEIGLIDGNVPGSLEEWRVAVSLVKFKVPFDYQFWILGGTRTLGGLVVDFVVHIPFAVPLEVFGRRWHSGSFGNDDRLKLAVEAHYFGGREPIVIWDYEIPTQEASDSVVRRELRL